MLTNITINRSYSIGSTSQLRSIFIYKQHYIYLFFFAWYVQWPIALTKHNLNFDTFLLNKIPILTSPKP